MYEQLTSAMKNAYLQLSKTVTKHPDSKGSWFTEELRHIKNEIKKCRDRITFDPTEESITDLKYWKT